MPFFLFFIILAVSIGFGHGALCKPGQTWIDGKFKMECYGTGQAVGYRPIACVPSGKEGGKEYFPGWTWVENDFKFQCEKNGQSLGTAIVGCIAPVTNQEIPVGSSLAVSGRGKYRCTRRPNGSVIREVESGCVHNNNLYAFGTSWSDRGVSYKCSYNNNEYQVIVENQQAPRPQPQPHPQPQPKPQPQPGKLCTPGDVWVQNSFKMECYTNGRVVGYQAVACVPSGKLGGAQYYPGQTWVDGSYKYRCEQDANQKMSFEVDGCVSPTKQAIAIGSSLSVPEKGLYECTRKDGTVLLQYQQGCIHKNKLVQHQTSWIEGNVQLTCLYGNDKFEAKATACLSPNRVLIDANTYKTINGKYYKCVQDQKDFKKAELQEMKN